MLTSLVLLQPPPLSPPNHLHIFTHHPQIFLQWRQNLSPSPPPAIRASTTRQSVVMMAKREEELKEIRAKTTEEINDEIVDLKGELFMLRLQRSARNEFSPVTSVGCVKGVLVLNMLNIEFLF
ncbi:putative ribosomal protein L29/L35 [Helianthus annuus]|nr:putative ribosomal protein L29/L35 [Helianthus annuus]